MQNPQQLLNQATRLARSGQLDQALNLAVQLPSSPVKFQFQIDLLINRRQGDDIRKAEDICAQWRKRAPGSVQPLFHLMQLLWTTGRVDLLPPLALRIGEMDAGNKFTPYYQAVSQQLNGDSQAAVASHRLSILRNAQRTFSETELELEVAIAVYEIAAGHYPASPGLREDALVEEQFAYDLLNSAITRWLDSKPEIAVLDSGQVTRYGNACYNLGCANASRYVGLDSALAHFRNALLINPAHEEARTNDLFVRNYDPDLDGLGALGLSLEASRELRQRLGPPMSSWTNERDPERVLKIAYLSSDFRRHSVAHFITPVVEAHDRTSVETHAFYTGQEQDVWTRRIASAVDRFHAVHHLSDKELHREIIRNQIDILVDLNGFTRGHRVETLMRRAAPVQVNWIGYPGSTGLDVMDYRIVDSMTDPDPVARSYSSEKLLYLEPVFSVYLPDSDIPDMVPGTPFANNGFFTFGSFNSLPKLNTPLLKMWGEILSRVDNSKLLVKNKMLDYPSVRRDVADALAAAGIEAHRQILIGRTDPPQEHMKTYQNVDLCLDSYPYNGTTTNCDSFIMGVPVVALTGDRHASRVTTSHLHALGLGELAASDPEQYVEIAVQLASDVEKLDDIRRGLRENMQTSALMDYPGFTRQLEARYRDIWQEWCARTGPAPAKT